MYKGDRVKTPSGIGTVVYVRMAAPDYSKPEAVSVKLDGNNHTGSMWPASAVTLLDMPIR